MPGFSFFPLVPTNVAQINITTPLYEPDIFETTLSHPHSSSMKLSIAFPSLAVLVLPAIVAADDRHVARFDVTKLFPGADFRVDADPALQSSNWDEDRAHTGQNSGRTYGSVDLFPAFIQKIQRAMNMAVNIADAAFYKVQMVHITRSSSRHTDRVREVIGDSVRTIPVKKSEATTAFYVQEASSDAYLETDDGELCIPFVEGSAVHFDGQLPHQVIVPSGAIKLLGPFQLSTLRSVVCDCAAGVIDCSNDPSACDQDPGTCCVTYTDPYTFGCCEPSCPTTTTTSTTSTTLPAKSGKSGSKSGKWSKALGGAGSEASSGADDPMLFAAEGSLSVPTEFNEWGKLVSMSMENDESTNF
jgi:hypothetical protein